LPGPQEINELMRRGSKNRYEPPDAVPSHTDMSLT
jgi:hypothetical protein